MALERATADSPGRDPVTPPQTLAGIRPATQKTTPKMDAILTRVWARVLIPSLSDLFFLRARRKDPALCDQPRIAEKNHVSVRLPA